MTEYAERDIDSSELAPHYSKHVMAMTAEGLHSKSDIAAELAWRDARIAQLEQWQRDMVAKAAEKSLDGYRDLGQRTAKAEAERDEAFAKGKQVFDELLRMKDERAQAIQQAVKRARMEWAREDKAELDRLKAGWQAAALETAVITAQMKGQTEVASWLQDLADTCRLQDEEHTP